MRRIGLALGWQRSGFDSLARAYQERAGQFNRGLAPRESLLVTADSISAGLFYQQLGARWWSSTRRLFATLQEATRRYPGDPEVWYALGDAQFHFGQGPRVGVPERTVLATFDRAIALDSAFGPAYIHPVALGLFIGGPSLALKYARPYLALDPKDVNAQGIRLIVDLLQAPDDETAQRVIDSATTEQLAHAWHTVSTWPDSAETGLRLALERSEREKIPFVIASAFLYRGHLREALRAAGDAARPVVAEAAMAGGMPKDSAATIFGHWLRRDTTLVGGMVRFWVEQRDTMALRDLVRLADAMARGTRTSQFRNLSEQHLRDLGHYIGAGARAQLALARGDTSQALARLLSLPDTLCPSCSLDRLTTAQLLAARGRHEEAATILNRGRPNGLTLIDGGLWQLERGRVNEQLGRRGDAMDAYRFVADLWHAADPPLEPLASEARTALQRLAAEPQLE
jgi:serine/threonine-protein kinase